MPDRFGFGMCRCQHRQEAKDCGDDFDLPWEIEPEGTVGRKLDDPAREHTRRMLTQFEYFDGMIIVVGIAVGHSAVGCEHHAFPGNNEDSQSSVAGCVSLLCNSECRKDASVNQK